MAFARPRLVLKNAHKDVQTGFMERKGEQHAIKRLPLGFGTLWVEW